LACVAHTCHVLHLCGQKLRRTKELHQHASRPPNNIHWCWSQVAIHSANYAKSFNKLPLWKETTSSTLFRAWHMTFKNRSLGFNVACCLLLAAGPNFPIPSQAVLPHGGTGQCVNHSGGCDIVMGQQAQRSEGWPNPGYMGNVCVGPLKVDRKASLG
jgi:hypothetical protein